VGSPLRLQLVVAILVAVLLAGGASAGASIAGADADALTTANAFVDALQRNDAERVCALFSPGAIARLGGEERCRASMSESEDDVDYAALETLLRGYTAARLSATKRKGMFVTRKFGARKLARDMEQLDPEVTVKLGRSSAAAKGQLVTTVVLDTRSTARRIVLYAESDDGSIFRLSGATGATPRYEEVGTGIPETSKQNDTPTSTFTGKIDSVTVDEKGTAYARGTFVITDDDDAYRYGVMIVLVPLNGTYFVDDLYYSTFRDGS
jgi:hypothetical protein